jgi:hypothetical protein
MSCILKRTCLKNIFKMIMDVKGHDNGEEVPSSENLPLFSHPDDPYQKIL